MGRDLEVSGHGLIDVESWQWSGGKGQQGNSGIRTEHFPNTSTEFYYYTITFSICW
jgi:hypothetical protein